LIEWYFTGSGLVREVVCGVPDHRNRSEAKHQVIDLCLAQPARLHAVAELLRSQDSAWVPLSVEVLAQVAAEQPAWVVPFAPQLVPLLSARKTLVRATAQQALLILARSDSKALELNLKQLHKIVRNDTSVVMRNGAVYMAGQYGRLDADAAQRVWPILKEALLDHHGIHATTALKALAEIAASLELRIQVVRYSQLYRNDSRAIVREAARLLLGNGYVPKKSG
jgi:hypothetical protein